MAPCILLIEDHADIVEVVTYNLRQAGYEVCVAMDGQDGYEQARDRRPALILLDLMLPRMNGLTVCRKLKELQSTKNIPMIMLTAKGTEQDTVSGLQAGADDYVTKSFSPKELLARIGAVLRRIQPQASGTQGRIRVGYLEIDPASHQVKRKDEEIPLTLTEFQLLTTLASGEGKVFTRSQLIDKVRGVNIVIVDRNIDVHIASLRKKLKECGEYIVTVRGVGYRFDSSDPPSF